jgi:hypothetical protein
MKSSDGRYREHRHASGGSEQQLTPGYLEVGGFFHVVLRSFLLVPYRMAPNRCA